ncbi:transposase [Thermodesulfobacteriota bacterium]
MIAYKYQQLMGKAMIHIKNHKQGELFDPWSHLSPKRRTLLEESWAGLFREQLLCELPVAEIAPSFTKDFGRPTKELHAALGVMVLQQSFDLTDEETLEQFAFNTQWHYALNITEESDSAKYMSPKTLWNIRNTVIKNQLDTILFDRTTNKLANVFNVNTDKQRIDSVHIQSNMRRLGRIGIFSKTIHKFLVNLKRNYKEHFEKIDNATKEKYLSEKALGCFSMVKPSESAKTLLSLSADLFDLVQQFKDCQEVVNMHSYKLLTRVLKEQCNVNVTDDSTRVEVKKPKDVPSDSLQNPSDQDATFSGHKGQGYKVQVMETYTETEDKESKAATLNLITHVGVEKACQSDAKSLIPAIESTKKRELCPKKITADCLYGSDDNYEDAKEMEVDVISPVKKSSEKGIIQLKDFKFYQDGHVQKCPTGNEPVLKKKKKTRFTQGFSIETCSQCTLKDQCIAKPGKQYYYLRYEAKAMRVAKRKAIENTDAFKDEYRWRAGVEATMSEYDRRTGVKHLRFRGFDAVRFCAVLKAIGINLFRATAVRRGVKPRKGANQTTMLGLNQIYSVFKELLGLLYATFKINFSIRSMVMSVDS